MVTTTETIIEVTRKSGTLSSIKVIMPAWNEHSEDGKILTRMPMLGGLITYALDEADAEVAIREAIHCFCLAAEKHGMGVERELMTIGWCISAEESDTTIMRMPSSTPMFDLMIETGETKALDIEMEAA